MTPLEELEALLHVAISVGDKTQAEVLTAELDGFAVPSIAPPLAAALWYAEQGLPVFALAPGSKIPHRGTRGCLDASTDADTIRGWWKRWPDSNVAVNTGGRIGVVDVDGPTGQASRVTNWQMFQELHEWSKVGGVTGVVSTPRPGGMHIYGPANPAVRNGTNLLPGVDYRGAGGYVVAPTSVISPEWAAANDATPGPYRWLKPLQLAVPEKGREIHA